MGGRFDRGLVASGGGAPIGRLAYDHRAGNRTVGRGPLAHAFNLFVIAAYRFPFFSFV